MSTLFAPEIIGVIYQRGKFSPELTSLTAQVLKVYGVGTTIFLYWAIAMRAMQATATLKPLIMILPFLACAQWLAADQLIDHFSVAGAVLSTIYVHLILLGAVSIILHRKAGLALPIKELSLALGLTLLCGLMAYLVRSFVEFDSKAVRLLVESALYGLAVLPLWAQRLTGYGKRQSLAITS